MSADDALHLVQVLLAGGLLVSAWGWTRIGRRASPPVSVVLLAAAAAAAVVPDEITTGGHRGLAVLVVLTGLLAVFGGGPVTARVFAIVDGASHPADHALADAGSVLRGGAWIGSLERAAIFACLVAGLPEGIAIVVGLKGLGRYPELRNQEVAGAAERFIIGTFTSVLWAAACAGVVLLVTLRA